MSANVPVTEILTIPITTIVPVTAPAPVSTDGPSEIDRTAASQEGSSQAWIAAPVVGSVAALVVIAVMFIMLGKRRRNNGASSNGSISSGNSTVREKSSMGNIFTTWLPSAQSTMRRGMGNISSITSKMTSSSSGSTRSGVLGSWRSGGGPAGSERLDDIEETPVRRPEKVRDSLNPLGQNRW